MYVMPAVTMAEVVTGTPVAGLTPEAMDVMLAMGRPWTILLTAVLPAMTPVQAAPETGEVVVAMGRPLTRKVGAVPVMRSPVTEVPVVTMIGVGIGWNREGSGVRMKSRAEGEKPRGW